MEPLQTIAMPSVCVTIDVTKQNSWGLERDGKTVRLAYVATDSTDPLSFVTLQGSTPAGQVKQVRSRPTLYDDMPHGVVVELYLADDLKDGEAVQVTLAQAGATTYFPPQQIDDTP